MARNIIEIASTQKFMCQCTDRLNAMQKKLINGFRKVLFPAIDSIPCFE